MAALKSLYYIGGFTLAGYLLMNFVERDPEKIRQMLPEKHEVDYESASQKRSAAFMTILKHSAAGDNPEEAIKKLKIELDKAPKTS